MLYDMSEPPAHDFDPAESPIAQEAMERAREMATARADADRTSEVEGWIEVYDATMARLTALLEDSPRDAMIYIATLIDRMAQLPSAVAFSAEHVAGIEARSMEEALARQFNLSAPIGEKLREAFDAQRLLSLAVRWVEEEGWAF